MIKLSSTFAAVPRAFVLEILLAAFCVDLLTLSLPIFSQLIFDRVIIHNSFSTLYVIGFGVLVATLFEGLLVYIYARHVHYLSAGVDEFLTRPVIQKLMTLPLHYFDARPKGQIATNVREIHSVRDFLSASSVAALVDIVFMIFVLALMALYSSLLAIVVASCIPILVVLSIAMRPRVAARYEVLSSRQSNFESLLNEGLQNIATLKSMALEPVWIRRWTQAHKEFVDAGLSAKQSAATEDTILRVMQRLISLAVLWVGAIEVLRNSLTLGQLLACYMFSLRVLQPSTRIFQVVMSFTRIQEALKNLEKLYQERPEEVSAIQPGAKYSGGSIVFKDVSFRYLSDRPLVLKDINLVLPEGAFIGIVGQSGSGKSTLSRMLQRHLLPDTGSIKIGENDIRNLDLDHLRRAVVLVSHDSALFKGTVRENIVGHALDATNDDLWRACELAEAKKFIEEMPNGLDTVLDEKAMQLSSGQKQRIALARALFARPSVLILDEATNALDAETEAMVLRHIHRELQGRSLIVVTHREHVLRDADSLIEVSQGGVRLKTAQHLPLNLEPQ